MTMWALVLFWVLLCLAAGQAVLALGFVRAVRHVRPGSAVEKQCPKAAVLLCLRGPDPFLPACLEGILNQDYPDYDLYIVVDSREDAAWTMAERIVARQGARNVRIKPLTDRRQTCSLKCSSLVQAVSELDASEEVIALLDADTVPHRTWLRELVAPLADDRVGAATGNRWYMPASATWGSLVRWAWNAAAVVQMFWFRIPWGGTLAIKTSVMRQSDLPARWSRALSEDTMLYGALRRLGLRVVFVPSLMMVNREGCSLKGFYDWVRRQLLVARLYHPAWPLVVGHGLGTLVAQSTALASLGLAAGMGNGQAAGWLAAGMGLYWSIMAGLLAVLEISVRRQTAGANWIRFSDLVRIGIAMLLTQALHAAALVSAMFLRTVEWRGIRYRVDGPEGIRMIEHRPYAGGAEPGSVAGSL